MTEDKKEQIENLVKNADHGLSQRELAIETGYSRPTVRKYAENLVDSDKLDRQERGPMVIYIQEA